MRKQVAIIAVLASLAMLAGCSSAAEDVGGNQSTTTSTSKKSTTSTTFNDEFYKEDPGEAGLYESYEDIFGTTSRTNKTHTTNHLITSQVTRASVGATTGLERKSKYIFEDLGDDTCLINGEKYYYSNYDKQMIGPDALGYYCFVSYRIIESDKQYVTFEISRRTPQEPHWTIINSVEIKFFTKNKNFQRQEGLTTFVSNDGSKIDILTRINVEANGRKFISNYVKYTDFNNMAESMKSKYWPTLEKQKDPYKPALK